MIGHSPKLLILWLSLLVSPLTGTAQPTFIRGADVSFLPQLEQKGVLFTDEQGIQVDLLELLKKNGINTIRLRLWHTPAEGWNDLESTLELARRIKEADLHLLLDIHYSDTWADPGRQTRPAAWDGLPFEILEDSLYAYTFDTISALVAQDTPPRIIQIGNEIIQGFLWDEGRVGGSFDTPTQWAQLAQLLNTAIQAARDASTQGDAEIMIHIDRGADVAGTTWFFDNLMAQGVEYDLIGLSYYPWWHGSIAQMQQTVTTAANRYDKPVLLVETAYPWTLQWFDNTNNIVGLPEHELPGYEASPEGQHRFLKDVINVVQEISPEGGVVYWAPEYVAVTGVGSPWENVALFDNNWQALPGIQAFSPSSSVHVEAQTAGEKEDAMHIYPNPSQDQISLEYEIATRSYISIQLFDVLGQPVQTVMESRFHEAGQFKVDLDLSTMPPGIIFVRYVSSAGYQSTKSVLRFR